MEGVRLLKEYLDLAEQYPTPMRMVRGHTFGLIGQCTMVCCSMLHPILPDFLHGGIMHPHMHWCGSGKHGRRAWADDACLCCEWT